MTSPTPRRALRCASIARLVAAVMGVAWGVSVGWAATKPATGIPTDPIGPLVFPIEYVGTDYPNAVRDGVIVSTAEYGEVLRYVREVHERLRSRGKAADSARLGLDEVRAAIERRAPAPEVFAATRRVIPELSRLGGEAVAPAVLPNVANGRRLYARDCAPCHGATGAGDGPSSPGMDPPPTAFRGDTLERLSPRQIYNTLTFGIVGTAMPSFADAYDEQQRWDLAFYLPTSRLDFAPRRPPSVPPLDLAEVAAASNVELLALLRRQRPDADLAEVDYLRVNFISPQGGVAPFAGADAGAALAPAQSLPTALALQNTFTGVAQRILPRTVGVSGWVRDPQWSEAAARAQKGEAWVAAHADSLRYPGFRRLTAGSGLLVDEDGFVFSSDQLLRDEQGEVLSMVEVELPDQTHLPAVVVGSEPTIDLAVVRVAEPARLPRALPSIAFADSDRLESGHWVLAAGDPPGPEVVFAVGVVAAPPQRQCYQELLSATGLQTSLDLPPSALGGPVVDIFGHVVGLDVRPVREAISSPSAKGREEPEPARLFTLPINLVLNIAEALKTAQSKRSPWLGISVLELPLLRARLGSRAASVAFPQTGVAIDDVYEPSPAAAAGLRPGDFLFAFGGHPLLSVGDFQTWLYVSGIGKPAELEIQRDGRPMRVTVTIEERPAAAKPR